MNPLAATEKLNLIAGADAVIYYNQNGETVSLKTQGMKQYNLNETDK